MSLRKSLFTSIAFAAAAVFASRAGAQANVVENQTTLLYVDASAGSDSNAGAQSTPFKTVQAGVNKANSLNQQGIGVKVIVNPGVYRETVNIGNYKTTSATLTIQAAVSGKAIISGSDVVSGWTQENSTTWQAPFSHTTGFCAIPSGWPTNFAPVIQRTEMVFVNGTPLTQVIASNQLTPGTFFFSDGSQMVHISPPAGTNMSTAVVELASRSTTLWMGSRSNVVLRGLAFQHAANCLNASGVSINSSNNVLIDSVQANWNNWGGMGIYSSNNVTLQNSVASYNGGAGFMGNKDQNILLSFNESDYNNWRGAQGAFYDWAMGGTKYFQTHGATVKNHFSYNNQAQGLWFDTDNQNITIDGSTLSGNLQSGLQIERDLGPITVQNSTFCANGPGINVLTSPSVTIKNNTFYSNGGMRLYGASLFVAGQANGITINDWVTGTPHTLFTTGMVLSGNTFMNDVSGKQLFGTYLSGNDYTQFTTTLNAGNNNYYDSTSQNSFKVLNGKLVNLGGWQGTVQTDYSSVWQAPATSPAAACTAPTPTFSDFNVNVDNNVYTMSAAKASVMVKVNSFGYGPVNLKMTGLPSGVTASFSQSSLTSGVATLTLTAAPTATTQKVLVTLWGTSGSRVHSVSFYVNVSAA
jgi:Right handed beta helix region